ncbi:MAG: hypothetical protein ABW026_00870 [Microvirga sp.]
MVSRQSAFFGSSHYFFNLTNGREVIPDTDGIELSDIDAVMVYVFEMIEQMKSEPGVSEGDWLGWRFEIADASGRRVHSIPLDDRSDWFATRDGRPQALVLHS